MKTALESLDALEALARKIAAFKRGGVIDTPQLIEHDEIIGEARQIIWAIDGNPNFRRAREEGVK